MRTSHDIFGDHWIEVKDGDPRALWLFEQHYSAYKYADGRKRRLFVGPGEKMVLMTVRCDGLFVWRKFRPMDHQNGVNCCVFRNESDVLSSELIREAMGLAWRRWPGERLYTYVNAAKIRSINPGACFRKAGWQRCGTTKKRGLIIFECLPKEPYGERA